MPCLEQNCRLPVDSILPIPQISRVPFCGIKDGWMADLRFYVPFNSISVISGRWAGDNERLCAMEWVFAMCTSNSVPRTRRV